MEKLDYKKEYKDLYLPKTSPMLIDVPEMTFLAVSGEGDPNTSKAYQEALELLYGLSFTIKMSKLGKHPIPGYFEYVVPPLEGLWQKKDSPFDGSDLKDKNMLCWVSMIRQPEFVTPEVFAWAKQTLAAKKPGLNPEKANLIRWKEGLCCQVMHIGPYDEEPATIEKMAAFLDEKGLAVDFNEERKHHEIYLSDPRRTKPERLKTVIRHPVIRK